MVSNRGHLGDVPMNKVHNHYQPPANMEFIVNVAPCWYCSFIHIELFLPWGDKPSPSHVDFYWISGPSHAVASDPDSS